jgi:hypothetical protein
MCLPGRGGYRVEPTRYDVLVPKSNAKGFAFNDEIIVLLCAQAQAVVLTVAKGEADAAAVRLYLVACQNDAATSRFSASSRETGRP